MTLIRNGEEAINLCPSCARLQSRRLLTIPSSFFRSSFWLKPIQPPAIVAAGHGAAPEACRLGATGLGTPWHLFAFGLRGADGCLVT